MSLERERRGALSNGDLDTLATDSCPYVVSSVSHRDRGNSHLGSEGSSSSETLASIGPSLDDKRAIRTSGVLEFMEELESKDTCLGAKGKPLSSLKTQQ